MLNTEETVLINSALFEIYSSCFESYLIPNLIELKPALPETATVTNCSLFLLDVLYSSVTVSIVNLVVPLFDVG